MVYWDETHSYYDLHTDTNVNDVILHSGYVQEDGTIDLYYCDGHFDKEAVPSPDFVITLQPNGDGYYILSNQSVE